MDQFIVQRWTLSEQRNHFLFPLNCLEIRDPFDPTEDELREILSEEGLGRQAEEEAGASILAHFAGGNAEESEGVFMRDENNEDGNGDGNESEWY